MIQALGPTFDEIRCHISVVTLTQAKQMIDRITGFAREERGAVSVDWLVLTGVLVATGIAVVGTVSDGVETAAVDTAEQLRGQVIQRSFGPDNLCSSGIDGLQARETARVAAGGADAVDVENWLSSYASSLSDADLIAERDRLADSASGSGWSRDDTLQGLIECGMAQRGI
ncbi:hypothetical protein JDO7802_00393 [Jannaschia donghaensis]|uniref:Flp pilus assembly protein, pilin Flp n=2 Tax=Jannaschia donghaensis TaxID=420998 RepID=A0A0M6YDH1_9RHOB|nr:hypothetical protein JDO7802_00393 [Jannaschia donghaensis]